MSSETRPSPDFGALDPLAATTPPSAQVSQARIPVGHRHRTIADVTVWVHDYDHGVATIVLPSGSVFQPWEPLDHWRGRAVPITLGDGASCFDWGVTSADGHFLHWDDFLTRCELADEAWSAPDIPLERRPFSEHNERQWTRLHYAAARGEVETIKELLSGPQRDGYLDLRDTAGRTAADVAKEHGHNNIAIWLRYEQACRNFFG